MKQFILLAVTTLLVLSCNQRLYVAQQPIGVDDWSALTNDLFEIQKQGHINGFSVAIVNENETLYEQGFGFADKATGQPYTENTLQHIASVSKTMIGIALMKAQELGKLKLDDPIQSYLTFDVANPYYPDEPITIRHLATHTSTIVDTEHYMNYAWILKKNQDLTSVNTDYPDQQLNPAATAIPMEDFLKMVLSKQGMYYEKEDGFLQKKPGELFEYSNIGAALAALVLEKATGESFDVFTTKHILKPLGMLSSGWSFDAIEMANHSRLYSNPETLLPFYTCITYPDGGLITSSSDIAKYLTELIQGYSGNGTLLSKESYQVLFTEQLQDQHFLERNENHPYNDEYNTGIFMGFSAKGYVGHAGGDAGVGTWMFFDKKTKTGRFIVKNTDANNRAEELAYYAVWDKLKEHMDKKE